MNKITTLILILAFTVNYSQIEFQQNGAPNFKIFWNYHNDFTKDVTKKSAFELKRVYLGYKHNFNENISTKVTYDIGSNSSGSEYTAYVKIAQLDWKLNPKLKLSMGLIGNKQFNDQEKLWGYRYTYKGFLNEFKFGASADLGINSEFIINPKLKVNLFVFNGEGYKALQDDDGYQRVGTSFIYSISNKIFVKIYLDSHPSKEAKAITNSSIFLGYNNSDIKLGVEYGKIKNGRTYKNAEDGHNRDGYSVFAIKSLKNNFEIYVRYDSISSNIISGQSIPWNNNDGSLLMFGTQYQAVKGVKFNLNYRLFNFDNTIINTKSAIYLNAEFKI
tara:strand:+ start:63 stop:1055 length:993 start_codon:yes stop_codon:yes gene_type:complete